jgi:hypothetical protein
VPRHGAGDHRGGLGGGNGLDARAPPLVPVPLMCPGHIARRERTEPSVLAAKELQNNAKAFAAAATSGTPCTSITSQPP